MSVRSEATRPAGGSRCHPTRSDPGTRVGRVRSAISRVDAQPHFRAKETEAPSATAARPGAEPLGHRRNPGCSPGSATASPAPPAAPPEVAGAARAPGQVEQTGAVRCAPGRTMGNCAGRSDFEWVYTDQPHTQRRKEMLGERVAGACGWGQPESLPGIPCEPGASRTAASSPRGGASPPGSAGSRPATLGTRVSRGARLSLRRAAWGRPAAQSAAVFRRQPVGTRCVRLPRVLRLARRPTVDTGGRAGKQLRSERCGLFGGRSGGPQRFYQRIPSVPSGAPELGSFSLMDPHTFADTWLTF
ncbi:Hypothetical predicted protein [Marmota monax]|uniref:Sphingolipid delta4-desaturase N-terminal domain-containing protein n=1 Tax=Marmota monax TaxID=9995 RepID=A0A5E4AQU5_MARMO|nr:hypothetical protein GHT09_006350 [Marmota monax]VTJ59146.1 Hypothetical predicted protein [Marmota monax]